MKLYMIVSFVLSGVFLILFLVLFPSIVTSVNLIKMAARFVYSNLLIIFVPVVISVFMIGLLILGIVGMMFILSLDSNTAYFETGFGNFEIQNKVTIYAIYFTFAIIWNIFFLKYCGVFIVSCAHGIWYYS